jgi:hypothetical protein
MFYSKSTDGFYDTAIHGDNIPADAIEITREQHAALLEGQSIGKRIVADSAGFPALQDPPPPTLADIIRGYIDAVQSHMDSAARDRGYDDIKTAVTYADEPAVPKFQQEGIAFRAWRSLCWAYCYDVLDAVQSGERAQPELADLIAELPALSL